MDMFGASDMVYDEDDAQERAENIAPQEERPALLPPALNTLCLGHEANEKLFLDLWTAGRLPHAMIFAGPRGVGKTTMAYRLARFLLMQRANEAQDSLFGDAESALPPGTLDVDTHDPNFSRIAANSHADFRYFDSSFNEKKDQKTIGVEVVRLIEPALRQKAVYGGWRVMILRDADMMTRNAQNALLKIFEEPPPQVLMILIVNRLGAMIPTIRSRARVLQFNPLGQLVMERLLQKGGILPQSAAERGLLLHLAQGSIGRAMMLSEGGGLATLQRLTCLLDEDSFPNWPQIHHWMQEIGERGAEAEKEYAQFQDMVLVVLDTLITAKARGNIKALEVFRCARLGAMAEGESLERLLERQGEIKTLFERTEFSNLDRREAVRGVFHVLSQ